MRSTDRVLIVHNRYQQPGGEDVSTAAEALLLRQYGHEVLIFEDDNDRITGMNKLFVACATVWNPATVHRLEEKMVRFRPHLVHFHNTFPLISPAAYYAVRKYSVPTVQTLHNYRLLCCNGQLFRDGHPCEECLHQPVKYRGIMHGCYRGNRLATTVVATMLATHHYMGTYHRVVSAYIALTEFARQKFIDAGLPAGKIHVKPNFVYPDPGAGSGGGGYALFVGRLSEEKGIRLMIAAWKAMSTRYPLKIVGAGPMLPWLKSEIAGMPWIEFIGYVPTSEVLRLMGSADLLVFPSQWYEGMPRVLLEALAVGLPAVALRLGGMPSVVDHMGNGVLCDSDDPQVWSRAISSIAQDASLRSSLGSRARRSYVDRFGADENYKQLVAIYDAARSALVN